MTDKEFIQSFRECMKRPDCEGCPWTFGRDGCNIGIFSNPVELVNRLEVLLAENERLRAQTHEWVSVEDRLPDYAGDYLAILAGTREMAVLDFDTLPRSWTDGDGVEYAVTHWMPTPLRPEEAKKDG